MFLPLKTGQTLVNASKNTMQWKWPLVTFENRLEKAMKRLKLYRDTGLGSTEPCIRSAAIPKAPCWRDQMETERNAQHLHSSSLSNFSLPSPSTYQNWQWAILQILQPSHHLTAKSCRNPNKNHLPLSPVNFQIHERW